MKNKTTLDTPPTEQEVRELAKAILASLKPLPPRKGAK